MNKDQQREELLLEKLRTSKRLSINEVMTLFNISQSTARRMFIKLVEKGAALRTFGGIALGRDNSFEYSFERVKNERNLDKLNIAKKAVSFIKDNETIYLDGGTTIAQLSQEIAKRIKNNNLKNVKIFTNSLLNLNEFTLICPINLIGGEYREHRRDFYGYIAEDVIKKLNFTSCFLGTDGFNGKAGFSTTDFGTARLNELVIEHSNKIYILTDSGKFDRNSLVVYANAKVVSTLITDKNIPENIKDKLVEQCVEVISV